MTKTRVLFVSQEITPYLPETHLSKVARELPQAIQERGREIRTFMPRYGCINERRNQLHEVIRLSGMNLIVDDNDQPLIIKVASIQAARMQVYFIDNEEYFQRKFIVTDKNDQFYADNDERMLFFCKGVIETVKKLGWSPDVIHCQGWMAALLPILIKRNFKDDPLFAESRMVVSLLDDSFSGNMDHRLAEKLIMDGIDKEDVTLLKEPSYLNLMRHAISFADGVIVAQENASEDLIQFAAQLKKPLLGLQTDETYADAYSAFYDEVLLGEPVAEMAE
ncbi:MAG TPA: glycogen/starch synthase [Flavobacteriales bacterium]|mgnify:CR=1 FL=1|nr:glycogen/starch synthase [Flavobacteriales bacterium]HPH82569.1 glycogen/starch synthase [Flavobacteriales bacterium]